MLHPRLACGRFAAENILRLQVRNQNKGGTVVNSTSVGGFMPRTLQ